MKPENLETLLLDRALGQLAPEVEDLLDAHVARDPAAARRAEALASTVSLARRAATRQAVPPPRAARGEDAQWRRVRRSLRWRAAGRDGLKLAAGLMLGLALMWFARMPSGRPVAAVTFASAPTRAVSEGRAVVLSAPTFWSAARIAAEAQRSAASAEKNRYRSQVRWLAAPGKNSKTEDKL